MKLINCPLLEQAKKSPTHLAVITENKKFTYQEFHNSVSATENYLKTLDISMGGRVAVFASNSYQYITLIYALWRIKAVTCLLNTRLPKELIDREVRSLNCKFIFSDNPLKKDNYRDINEIPLYYDNEENREIKIDLDQDATIISTSGSSNTPKAVLHTFANHYFSAKGSNKLIPFTKQHRWLINLPLYHVGGLSIVFRSILGGGAIVLSKNNKNISELIKKYKITHLSLVPTQLQRLIDDDTLKSCTSILVGGGSIWTSLKEKAIKHRLPIHLTYGLTEMSSQVATTQNSIEEGACVLSHCEVKIDDNKEILVKGISLFKEYIGDCPNTSIDNDGWYKTGDLGELKDGRLFVIGRRDNMFISGGENIHPEEIEGHLQDISFVQKAVVVPIPHKEYGARPVAFLKVNNEETISPEELKNSLSKNLPKYKIPDQFLPWPDIQESLKVKRSEFKEIAESLQ